MYSAKDIEALIVSMADERQAAALRRFFKTGAGQYGEGDKFLGVKNPQVRSVVKEAWKETPLREAVKLAQSPWHEVRLCGLLIMVAQFERAAKGCKADIRKTGTAAKNARSEEEMRRIFDTYLSLHPFINNWDLVDLSAYKIAGRYELLHPEITILDEWIRPEFSLWQRRISMVSTWIHIRHHQFDKALARAEVLFSSQHDLLHKAAGWMLREIYKAASKREQSNLFELTSFQSAALNKTQASLPLYSLARLLPSGSSFDEVNHDGRDVVEDFLEAHVAQMPSIMLSYTTELMPPGEREYWRQRRQQCQAGISARGVGRTCVGGCGDFGIYRDTCKLPWHNVT